MKKATKKKKSGTKNKETADQWRERKKKENQVEYLERKCTNVTYEVRWLRYRLKNIFNDMRGIMSRLDDISQEPQQ